METMKHPKIDDLVKVQGIWYFVKNIRVGIFTGEWEFFVQYGERKGWIDEKHIEGHTTKEEVLKGMNER